MPVKHHNPKIAFIIIAFLYLLSTPVRANSNTDFLLDDEEERFEEIQLDKTKQPVSTLSTLQNFIDRSHLTFRHELGSRLNTPGRIFINRSSLRLQWEDLLASHYYLLFDGKVSYNFAYHYLDYPIDVRREYRFQDQLREFYIQAGSGKISYKLGQQIVVWGEADGAVVTDVISPRDLTEFIFIPVEDARIGQVMLTIDYYSDRGQWTLVLNPDPKVNRFALAGHEYAYPFPASQPGIIEVRAEEKPKLSLNNMEVGVRWAGTIKQSDLSIMAAYIIDDNPVFKSEGVNNQGELVLQPEYRRYSMIGGTANLSKGNILWKGEAAFKINRTFTSTDWFIDDGLIERTSFDAALGLDYDASGAYSVTLEAANQYILNWADNISGIRRNESILYLTWSKDFFNETLTPQYIYVHQFQDNEALHRVRVSYEITDQWSCMFEIAYFNAWKEDSYLGEFQDQDRLSLEIRYDF